MGREELIGLLGENWEALQKKIREALSSDIDLLNSVNSGILANGGKMLRPMVCLLFAGACSEKGINEDSIRYGAASELLHNATLLHDDVADESDTRRGVPTLRSKLGPSAAVLVGDYWLASAVNTVIDTSHRDSVVKLFSKTLSDLAKGEMLQLEKAGTADTTLGDYYKIIYCKTASLFESAGTSGAISVDAPEEYVEAAAKYSVALGTAFQIKDDILDYDGDGSLGKPVGIDLKEKKITLPLFCAMSLTGKEEELRGLVRGVDSHPENVDAIRKMVVESGAMEKAEQKLEDFVQTALEALEALPDSPYKDALAQIAKYNSVRRS